MFQIIISTFELLNLFLIVNNNCFNLSINSINLVKYTELYKIEYLRIKENLLKMKIVNKNIRHLRN